jgi:hypothetical protein
MAIRHQKLLASPSIREQGPFNRSLEVEVEVAMSETNNVVRFSERSLRCGKIAIQSCFWRASST